MDGATWLLLTLFLAVAAVDWVAVLRRNKPLEYLAKPGCMIFLVLAALEMDPAAAAARTALVVALVLSTLGDVFLMLPGRQPGTSGPNLFVAGLGSFLLAHVAYVVGFVLVGFDAGSNLLIGLLVPLGFLVVGRRIVGAVRSSDEPELTVPVIAYLSVILCMVTGAFATGDPVAMAGATLFATSDSLIAWDRFVHPRPWAPLAIIICYHLAQALLVVSFSS